jgi:hypothetical protein
LGVSPSAIIAAEVAGSRYFHPKMAKTLGTYCVKIGIQLIYVDNCRICERFFFKEYIQGSFSLGF